MATKIKMFVTLSVFSKKTNIMTEMYGPFNSESAAIDWAEENINGNYRWVTNVVTPIH